jgi:hypothetical protein
MLSDMPKHLVKLCNVTQFNTATENDPSLGNKVMGIPQRVPLGPSRLVLHMILCTVLVYRKKELSVKTNQPHINHIKQHKEMDTERFRNRQATRSRQIWRCLPCP